MSPERARFGLVASLEHRPDKGGQATPSTLCLPNGSIAASTDVDLLNVMSRLVLEAWTP